MASQLNSRAPSIAPGPGLSQEPSQRTFTTFKLGNIPLIPSSIGTPIIPTQSTIASSNNAMVPYTPTAPPKKKAIHGKLVEQEKQSISVVTCIGPESTNAVDTGMVPSTKASNSKSKCRSKEKTRKAKVKTGKKRQTVSERDREEALERIRLARNLNAPDRPPDLFDNGSFLCVPC